MKALVKNYFPYEAEEMLYDLEKMKKQGFVLKKIIQNIYIFEPSKNDFKYFVYRIEKYSEFAEIHEELTKDHWTLIKSNRNWAVYKTERQNQDSGYTPVSLKSEVFRNIISELLVFIGFFLGCARYKYGIKIPKDIPPVFLSIELIGYFLFGLALICLLAEIISACKNRCKTSLRPPIARKIFKCVNILLLSTCIYVICIAVILIPQSLFYAMVAFLLVIYWITAYILFGASFGMVNMLTGIAGTTFLALRILY